MASPEGSPGATGEVLSETQSEALAAAAGAAFHEDVEGSAEFVTAAKTLLGKQYSRNQVHAVRDGLFTAALQLVPDAKVRVSARRCDSIAREQLAACCQCLCIGQALHHAACTSHLACIPCAESGCVGVLAAACGGRIHRSAACAPAEDWEPGGERGCCSAPRRRRRPPQHAVQGFLLSRYPRWACG